MNKKVVLESKKIISGQVFLPTAKFHEIYDTLNINPNKIITLLIQHSEKSEGAHTQYTLNNKVSLPYILRQVLEIESFAVAGKYSEQDLEALNTKLKSQQNKLIGILMAMISFPAMISLPTNKEQVGYIFDFDMADKLKDTEPDHLKMVLALVSSITAPKIGIG